MSRIAHLFFDTHMAFQHHGLGKLLEKESGERLPRSGETAIFINKKWTALKMLTHDGTLLYLKREKGINPETIKYLPSCVQGKELDYKWALDKAVREQFEKHTRRRGPRRHADENARDRV